MVQGSEQKQILSRVGIACLDDFLLLIGEKQYTKMLLLNVKRVAYEILFKAHLAELF